MPGLPYTVQTRDLNVDKAVAGAWILINRKGNPVRAFEVTTLPSSAYPILVRFGDNGDAYPVAAAPKLWGDDGDGPSFDDSIWYTANISNLAPAGTTVVFTIYQ